VALVFFFPPLIAFAVYFKERKTVKGLLFLPGWMVFILVAFPWFIYIFYSLGSEPLSAVAEKDIAKKVFDFGSGDPIYGYLLKLMGDLAPWIWLIVFFKPKDNIKKIFSSYEGAYIGFAFLIPLIIMSLIAEKHGKYILPLFPFLAAFLGIWGSEFYGKLKNRWQEGFQSKFTMGVGILLLGYFLFFVIVGPRLYSYRYEMLKPLAAKIKAIKNDFPVYCYGKELIQLIYYYKHPIPLLSRQELDEKISTDASFLLIVDNKYWHKVKDKGLCIKDHFAPFLKRNREVYILGRNEFCR